MSSQFYPCCQEFYNITLAVFRKQLQLYKLILLDILDFNLFTADLSKSYVTEVAMFFMMCNTYKDMQKNMLNHVLKCKCRSE